MRNLSHAAFFFVHFALAIVLAAAPILAAAPADLLLSEYVEGSSNNKAIEIWNGTAAAIDLAARGYRLEIYFNGSTVAETAIPLAGTVEAGGVFVVADADASSAIHADQSSGEAWFNGNDAVVLRRGAAVVDSLGRVGDDPGEGWTNGQVSTHDHTLRRQSDVCAGDLAVGDPFNPAAEWSVFPRDTFAGLGTHTASCDAAPGGVEIWEIQGSGVSSPLVGQTVTTLANVVTALTADGFFIQTPASRADADVDTSNGLFVFTGTAPAVAVGDLVDVSGQVEEFHDFTRLSGSPIVTVMGTEPLPPAVVFNASRPAPDPGARGCALEPECYEGMRVQVGQGTVGGGNQEFSSDPIAEPHVVAGPMRPFRERGLEPPVDPSLPATIPRWDGNPEIFEIDPDRFGLPNRSVPAGSSFSATGVLGYELSGYELWPTVFDVTPVTLPRAVRPAAGDELTIGSLNLMRLFDDFDDPGIGEEVVSSAEYERRRAKLVRYILEVLRAPHVLAVQEAEKIDVLEDLAADIEVADPNIAYNAFLIEGHDIGGIDVGFLVREPVHVDDVTQLGSAEIFAFDGSPLHDRPPLLLEARLPHGNGELGFAVLGVHQRSLSGIAGADGRVRQKRLAQAQSVATMIQAYQSSHTATPLVAVGDFNAYEFTDGWVDVIGQVRGVVDPAENVLSGPDLVNPDLTDQVLSLPAAERYSYVFEGSAQVLDHALTNVAAGARVRSFAYGRGNADAPEHELEDAATARRASDHDGFVLYLDAGDGGGNGSCTEDDHTLCLTGERFAVRVSWRNFEGVTGVGTVVPLGSADSGLFWFFNPNNWEMLVKVIDGCTFNNRFWVFAAATTNVEYTLRVEDTETGAVKEYPNRLGVASPAITDTSAFATCR